MNIQVFVFLVPPSVRAVPQTGQLTARKGGTITLECKASGNPGNYTVQFIAKFPKTNFTLLFLFIPVPSIFWTKKVYSYIRQLV